MGNYTTEDIVKKIIKFCQEKNIKYLFVSGNGASGKTELSKRISEYSKNIGTVNIINMDDFVVDTQLRSSARIEWTDIKTGEICSGKYSTVFSASYFLQNIKAILCNLDRGNNYWYWPKKAKTQDDCIVELKSDAILTIVEGIGSVYLKQGIDKSLSVFIYCSKEVEIDRRVKRAKFSNEQNREDVEKQYLERNRQFESIILPYKDKHDLVLESLSDFSFNVKKDDCNILL